MKKKCPPITPKLDANYYRTMSDSFQCRFTILAKIMELMRRRHNEGDDHPLSIDEILDEIKELDMAQPVKNWLVTEAFINNPKIKVTSDGQTFSYKPVFDMQNGKSLMRLLKKHALKGLDDILLDDVQGSIVDGEKVINNYLNTSKIIYVERPTDKKKSIFYNNREAKAPQKRKNARPNKAKKPKAKTEAAQTIVDDKKRERPTITPKL